jgi:hypothetical protein
VRGVVATWLADGGLVSGVSDRTKNQAKEIGIQYTLLTQYRLHVPYTYARTPQKIAAAARGAGTHEKGRARKRTALCSNLERIHCRTPHQLTHFTSRIPISRPYTRLATACSRVEAAHTHHEAAQGSAPDPRGRPEFFLTSECPLLTVG